MKSRTEAAIFAAALALAAPVWAEPVAITVTAVAETEGMKGDADDPAIWVNPADPAASLILGTDKQVGLKAYDLSGALVADFPDGKLNNVDIRPFRLGGEDVWLTGATKREDDTLVFYVIDGAGAIRRAEPFGFPGHPRSMDEETDDIYGFALQRMADGRVFALANYKSGHVFQWEVVSVRGRIDTRLARHWTVPSQPEGIVSDDRAGVIYVGEEDAGIWAFPGDPEVAAEGAKVVSIPSACLPEDDVEGLAIYDGKGRHLLVASAQGIHRVALYDLDDPAMPCLGLIEVGAGEAIDGVSETDGLEVTAAALPGMRDGMLVVMDDQNAGFTTNFKLIDWARIAAALEER